jgi:hypothetical protein
MSYDNIKLDKGLYTTGKGFTKSLEEIDPSENYIGTELEGLDAYQRQLKRFDIKVSGIGSDSVSKFFKTTDSSALFPEYIARAVRQGMDEADVLDEIVATTTVIDSLDYRTVESIPTDEDKELADVMEGAFIPETVIRTKEQLTPLKKRGRTLVASYEAIKFQKLDLFTVTLKQIGAYISRSQLLDAIGVLCENDVERIDYEGDFGYSNIVDLWNAFYPYKMTTILAGNNMVAKMLNMPEFRDSLAGLDFHGTGNLITPLGAKLVKTSVLNDENLIIGVDKSCAVEKVQVGDVVTDFDKIIDRQLERATITSIAGFSKIFADASKILQGE